jgi:hypothetical protein
MAVNDPTWALCEQALHQALARNSRANPDEALCALVWLLRDRHHAAVAAGARRAYREGFEWPDPFSRTLAEGIKDLAATAGEHGFGMEYRRAGNDRAVVCNSEARASAMQVIAEVLEELILSWDHQALAEAPAAAC